MLYYSIVSYSIVSIPYVFRTHYEYPAPRTAQSKHHTRQMPPPDWQSAIGPDVTDLFWYFPDS